MRICVTGVAGFLGSHLTKRLLAEGHFVVGLDQVNPLEAWRVHEHLQNENFYYAWQPLDASIRNLHPVDWIVHAAAITDPPYAHRAPTDNIYKTVTSTMLFLEDVVREKWCPRLLHISTFSVYGRNPSINMGLHEMLPLHPSTQYGVAKAAQEFVALGYQLRGQMEVTSLRMALMMGERERFVGAITSTFIRKALSGEMITLDGGGIQHRDINYVGNAVDAIMRVIDGGGVPGQIYNISSGTSVSVRDLAEMAIGFAGRGEIKVGDPRPGEEGDMILEGRKAAIELGYTPKISFQEGFDRTAAWVKERWEREERVKAGQ